MAYKHRIETQELDTRLATPALGTAGVQVVVGTAPINRAADPYSVTDVPIQANTFAEAQSLLGYSDDYGSYTLCQSMDASFKVFMVAPIILINVLDPAKHVAEFTESVPVASKMARSTKTGILLDTTKLTTDGGKELALDTDYIAEFNPDGTLAITLLTTSDTDGAASLTIAGKALDPSLVTASDIIGGYNVGTGAETGLEVIRQVYPKLGIVPRLIIAPGWSHIPEVAAVMASKTTDINGVFTSETVIDMDTEKTGVYTGLGDAKSELAITSGHAILLWPMVRIGSKTYYYSAIWAAMTAYTDASNNDVPVKSPSNKLLNVSAAVLKDGTEVVLDTTMAEIVNSHGIATIINISGMRAYGNNTSAYPGTTDPKDRWISCRRMMSWYRNRFIQAYNEKVDDPSNLRLVEAVVDAENLYLNSLTSTGDIAGGEISYSEADNTIESIMNGLITFRTRIAFWTPAEYIQNKIEFDPALVRAALGGE